MGNGLAIEERGEEKFEVRSGTAKDGLCGAEFADPLHKVRRIVDLPAIEAAEAAISASSYFGISPLKPLQNPRPKIS